MGFLYAGGDRRTGHPNFNIAPMSARLFKNRVPARPAVPFAESARVRLICKSAALFNVHFHEAGVVLADSLNDPFCENHAMSPPLNSASCILPARLRSKLFLKPV